MTDEQLIDELLNSSLNNDWANQAATKILEAAASRDRNVDEISPNEELEDAQLPKALPRASRKERVVLGRMTLAEIWIDMLGDGRHGKLSADQWRTACTVNLVVTLVRLWGLKSPNDRQYRMLMNFMDLVMACKLAMNRRTTPEHIERFQLHMHRYLETAKELYVYSSLTPNHHLSLHLPRLFENFGPPHAWNCFVFERCLRWLKFIKTSNKFGELEQTLLTRFCMSQEVRILMQSTVLPDALSDLQLAFSKALNGDSRGTFWNDLWAFTPEENFPMPTNLKEVPLLSCIRENLTKGLLGGIPTKHCPSVCLTQESFSFRGMHFSIATNSLGNSYVVFNMNAGSGESWLAGSIMTIFYLPTEGTTRGPFFIIRPYLPLNTADAQFDPYRKFLFVAGQLVYEECGDLLICTPDELVCHFAHTPYKSPNISKPCIHALPLDRE
ncbi:hypothetical protein BC826DRAFT_1023017 [Russula brevipes]|nr:hypothetical protein BC826DRAFT_1023017 [Russula brevipes]